MPNGWRWVLLGEACKVVSGATPSTSVSDYWGGDIPWVTPTDLGKLNSSILTTTQRRITQDGLASCSAEMVPSGTVLMSSRAPIGHLAVAGVRCCTNQGCKNLIPSESVDTWYLFFALKISVPELKALGSGATFTEISKTAVESFEIPLPPIVEQKRIAAILKEQMAAVERARAAAEARLEAAEALPAAYLRAVFNSPEAHQWPKKRLGEVCEIIARQVDPKLSEFGALPHVNGENIESGTCRLVYLNTAAQEGMTSGKYLFEPRDVLYSKLRPYLRKVVVVDFRGLCSADMYPIRANRELLDPYFTAWLLLSDEFTKYADEESRRARMPKLNREQLFAWRAPMPPLSEQRRIATMLSEQMVAAERTRKGLKEQLDTINKLPAALLRQAFDGRI